MAQEAAAESAVATHAAERHRADVETQTTAWWLTDAMQVCSDVRVLHGKLGGTAAYIRLTSALHQLTSGLHQYYIRRASEVHSSAGSQSSLRCLCCSVSNRRCGGVDTRDWITGAALTLAAVSAIS